MTSISKLYEPFPRFGHGAAAVGGRCYLLGGCVQNSSASGRKLSSTVEIFDPYLETWEKCHTTGVPPPGLYNGTCTSLLDSLYWFGGHDGSSRCNSLHRLDTTTLEWSELQPLNQADGPMRKTGCGMVSFLQDKMAVLGGYGILTQPTQPGAKFIKDTLFTDGRGWSNELHVFNITEGKWSSPPTNGPRPPPCAYFSFTAINNHQAVFFGGYQPGRGCEVDDCYLMNFESMEWTKLEKPEGAPWPVERSAHAACCLNYGEDHPQLLITGGMHSSVNTLQDAWILDVNSGRWRKLTLPEGAQPRMHHSATALSLGPGLTQVTMFGGCPEWESGKSDNALQKLAKTTMLDFESVELPPSGDGSSTREWVLVGVADSSQLRSTERLAELEKINRKSEHAHMREIEELKKQLCQIKDELASAKRQTRLALARAVRAEIETDKVPFLEQQLAQTKTDLEGQIQMKDQATIAAEQQLQQTKATLAHEIHMKNQVERQFNQEKAGLQHEIKVRDQKISSLQQQIYQTDKFLEHHKQAAMSVQQQFSHRGKNLEHQIEVTEQARVALEMQIRGRDREKAELEHQLHQKEEEIQAKDKEKVELEQQICQIKKHRPPEVTQVVEVQQEASGYVTTQGAVPSVHEDREAELSRLTHGSTAKQQEIEFELKAQIIQADALREDLQQQLKAKDIETIAIRRESQHNQDRIEALTDDNKEMAGQINFLEAKLVKLEFLEGASSQVVDQLREELMDKEVESTTSEKSKPTQHQPLQLSPLHSVPHLRGADVVSETTFTLTPEAQSFDFKGYGFKLHVPEGSLPVKVSETRLNVRVSLSGQFQLPTDYELISTVYWVSCPHKFTKPLVVEIQHCAALSSNEQCEQLTFVRTKCTQKELPHTFTEEGGVFSHHSSYGSLSLSRFSGLGVIRRLLKRHRVQPTPPNSLQTTQEQSASGHTTDLLPELPPHSEVEDREGTGQCKEIFDQYCGQVYIKKGIKACIVYFVITRNLDAERTIVKKTLQAREYIEMSFGFDEQQISLAIPDDGMTLKSGWKIIPLHNPMIKKANVDHFESSRTIPKCELLVRWIHGGKPLVCLEHKIDIKGAKGCSFFTLYIPDEDSPTPSPVATDGALFSPSSVSTISSPPRDAIPVNLEIPTHSLVEEGTTLGIETLTDISTYLHPLDKKAVFNLGLVLGLDYHRLKEMMDSSSFLQDMLAGWLQKVDQVLSTGVPTWKRLVEWPSGLTRPNSRPEWTCQQN